MTSQIKWKKALLFRVQSVEDLQSEKDEVLDIGDQPDRRVDDFRQRRGDLRLRSSANVVVAVAERRCRLRLHHDPRSPNRRRGLQALGP